MATVEHDQATLDLSKKESAEHIDGISDIIDMLKNRPLQIEAFRLDNPEAPADDEGNVKTVHFVRHGQGFHNFMADIAFAAGREWVQFSHTPENPYVTPEILDAPLTEKGRQQARILQPIVKSFPNQVELVVFSPLCRALQTGLIAFEHLVPLNIPFVANEMARETTGIHICDKRRPTSQQVKEFPQVDFSLVEDEEDVLFDNDTRETKVEVGERIYKFMDWLSSRPEEHVAVASHSGWLFTVFNGICKCGDDDDLKNWFQTGEMRSVKLKFTKKEE